MTGADLTTAFLAVLGLPALIRHTLERALDGWRGRYQVPRCADCHHHRDIHQGCNGRLGCAAGVCSPKRCPCPGYLIP